MILVGDVMDMLATLPANHVDCVVTSPPYWGLRDYGAEGQIGLEKTPELFIGHMRMVFEQVRRVLKPEGTLWLNLGDSYSNATVGKRSGGTLNQWKNGGRRDPNVNEPSTQRSAGMPSKNLMGIPWRMALALQSDGWFLRQDIIWHKPNPMPESVRDRCTKAHEYIFLLAKSERYYFDHQVIKEKAKPGVKPAGNKVQPNQGRLIKEGWSLDPARSVPEYRNKRSVWSVTTKPFKGAHFATFPPGLIEPCILAGCPPDGIVLDPFFGAGTTGVVAKKHGRRWIGIEINEAYAKLAQERLGA